MNVHLVSLSFNLLSSSTLISKIWGTFFSPARQQHDPAGFNFPPDVEGFLKPTIILFPTFDLEIFHASFTLFKPTKLRNFCSNGFNLWRGLCMPKKSRESGKF